MSELFERASRNKYRFSAPRCSGLLCSEDLWDLNLANLNTMAKELNKQLKANEEEDFIEVRKDNTELRDKFDCVLHVLTTLKAEQEAAKLAAERRAKKAVLLDIMAKQELAGYEKLSPEDLRKKIEELG